MKSPLPPDCAAIYEYEGPLSAGGFGTVYRARHRTLDRPVAIKVLTEAALSTDQERQRFADEALITARLRHPGIVSVYDTGQDPFSAWIAYELLPGPTLRAPIQKARLSVAEAIAITLEVLAGLEAAHAQGVVHRDVKPENVMQGADGRWKLLDFGVARLTTRDRVTQTGIVMGSPAYLAPELIRGGEPTAQADLYACGVMLFEMLAGRPPFDGETASDILHARLKSAAPRLHTVASSVPLWLDAAVDRALAREPSDRWSSATLMAQGLQLAETGDDETVQASRPGLGAAHNRVAGSRPTIPARRSVTAAGEVIRRKTGGHPVDADHRPPSRATPVLVGALTLTALGVGFVAGSRIMTHRMDHAPSRDRPVPPSTAVALPATGEAIQLRVKLKELYQKSFHIANTAPSEIEQLMRAFSATRGASARSTLDALALDTTENLVQMQSLWETAVKKDLPLSFWLDMSMLICNTCQVLPSLKATPKTHPRLFTVLNRVARLPTTLPPGHAREILCAIIPAFFTRQQSFDNHEIRKACLVLVETAGRVASVPSAQLDADEALAFRLRLYMIAIGGWHVGDATSIMAQGAGGGEADHPFLADYLTMLDRAVDRADAMDQQSPFCSAIQEYTVGGLSTLLARFTVREPLRTRVCTLLIRLIESPRSYRIKSDLLVRARRTLVRAKDHR